MNSTSTHTHSIDTGTARFLCTGRVLPSEAGQPTLLILSANCRDGLEVHCSAQGFELISSAPADTWADLFGVLPYRAGRVALAESERGAWRASLARMA